MNLLDFNANREKELFLLDIYSDRTIYGGNSETSLELSKAETGSEEEVYCKCNTYSNM